MSQKAFIAPAFLIDPILNELGDKKSPKQIAKFFYHSSPYQLCALLHDFFCFLPQFTSSQWDKNSMKLLFKFVTLTLFSFMALEMTGYTEELYLNYVLPSKTRMDLIKPYRTIDEDKNRITLTVATILSFVVTSVLLLISAAEEFRRENRTRKLVFRVYKFVHSNS